MNNNLLSEPKIIDVVEKNDCIEPTEYIKVHNYPPAYGTYSYITRTYRVFENKFGWKEVDGCPIYFHELSEELLVLSQIIGNAQNLLAKKLIDKFKYI